MRRVSGATLTRTAWPPSCIIVTVESFSSQVQTSPTNVWVAAGAEQRFPKGAPVSLRISVQPVDLMPATAPASPTPAPVGALSASPTSEPGDHAVVTGRIMSINPGGVLVVESPTGPIQVLSADSSRYKIGDAVQVRTSVRTAS